MTAPPLPGCGTGDDGHGLLLRVPHLTLAMLVSCRGVAPVMPDPAWAWLSRTRPGLRRRRCLSPTVTRCRPPAGSGPQPRAPCPGLLDHAHRDLQSVAGLDGVAGRPVWGGAAEPDSGAARIPTRGTPRPPRPAPRSSGAVLLRRREAELMRAAAAARQPAREPTVAGSRPAAVPRATASGTGSASRSAGRLASSSSSCRHSGQRPRCCSKRAASSGSRPPSR